MSERNTEMHLHTEVVIGRVDSSPFREHLQSTVVQIHGPMCNTNGSWSQRYIFFFNPRCTNYCLIMR